ncbi:PKD domain-containing protein [Saccharicrinis fermentans]|uniref:Outer membrane protein ArfA n=1 Tax=Saccharicrinis fermentans DSM 9555 = JCM 21142 TaxID=869213 RepID=W7Y6H4_9BACT|nr:PKD domain-containing protein [Saccharicrinis fermentans]GAF03233.1 outer membrane protein ArfA [Saccharicrinis fermentans DSM 9555 = JCM 21142]
MSFLKAQSNIYTIEKTVFSSNRFDEFAPVFYKGGIVFCSNRRNSSLVNYSNDANRAQFNIYFVEPDKKGKWKNADLFSKEITTKLNDGPVTFNENGDVIYFSRNMIVGHKLKKSLYNRNKLGVYSAHLVSEKWGNVREFRYNNDWFNITSPCLSPDEKRLYFSSDKPDGYGGADLYYCDWENGYWGDPVNLGPQINTDKNESYPFVNKVGELFFSSDRPEGMGGKDIYVTKANDDGWYTPLRLDSPINSEFDDFAMVTDSLGNKGYFSSDRGRTIDIYSFSAEKRPVWFSESQLQNNYCITLTDSGGSQVDTLKLAYEWVFSDGIKQYGKKVSHCFAGAGEYTAKVRLIDKKSRELFFHKNTYQISISNIEQPYIESSNHGLVNEPIRFDARKSYFRDFEIIDHYWQMDDTVHKTGMVTHYAFDHPGEKNVKLGLVLRSKENGNLVKKAVHKTVYILKNEKEKRLRVSQFLEPAAIHSRNNFKIVNTYLADNKLNPLSLYRLEVFSSPRKMLPTDPVFNRIPSKYAIHEIFQSEDGTFRYFVQENTDMMSLYPAYKELLTSGFKKPEVTFSILTDSVKMELTRILLKYGDQWDMFFNERNRLTTNGILMLNNIVELMNSHPDLKIEVGVHTDNMKSPEKNVYLTNLLAQIITNYLVDSGVSQYRLISKGYGDEFPIRSNLLETGRERNRRVEFKIIE